MKPVFNLGLAFMLGITPVIAAEPETGAPYSGTERSQEGPGGIIDVSGVMVLEFDWSQPQGRCRSKDGKFKARGIGIDSPAEVKIEYQEVVAPDTGRIVGQVFSLELKEPGKPSWATQVGMGAAGSIDAASLSEAEGGPMLDASGVMVGFQENRAPTGEKRPFRLIAVCDA